MNLWSVSFLIEDKFKNLFCEYFEDFEGYVSSSLFLQENNNYKKKIDLQNFYHKKILI